MSLVAIEYFRWRNQPIFSC